MAPSHDREPAQPVAGVIGPPGQPGPAAAPLRLDAAPAATWILPHTLGRVPSVQVFLAGGEAVLSDIHADSAQVTVTFATPQQGFALLF
jgi:hypothetical protein